MYAMDQTSHFEHRTETHRSRWELPRRRRNAPTEGTTLVDESSIDQPRTSDDYAD